MKDVHDNDNLLFDNCLLRRDLLLEVREGKGLAEGHSVFDSPNAICAPSVQDQMSQEAGGRRW